MAALARAALLSSRLNFATEVWPLLMPDAGGGDGGMWLGADYIPFERCIWTAGTRQPKAGEIAGTSFGAAGKATEGFESSAVIRCARPNHPQCRRGCTCLLPLGSAPPPLSSPPTRVGNGKAVLDGDGDASFSHIQYTSDAQGRTVSVHGPMQEEAATTTTGGGGGGGEVWLLLL